MPCWCAKPWSGRGGERLGEDRVEDGEAEARELMHALGVGPADLVIGAYLDLLSRDG